jgi:hypothetical protein
MDRTKKKTTRVECYFDHITDTEIRTYHGKSPRRRAVVTCSTEDQQLMFFEVREIMIDKIKELGVEVDDAVTIDFVFEGKQFNGRWFNNLFINDINFTE